jgi:hypothetical protein
MIRQTTRFGVAAVAALAASFGSTALAQAKSHCHHSGATTVASDSYAKVFTRNGNGYACVKATGKTIKLKGAKPGYRFVLGGKWVGWSSDATDVQPVFPNSVVTVMHIPNQHVNSYFYPFELNETVDKIVVASDGAAAWSMTPPSGGDSNYTDVQGTDRANHPPDQFSDDHADVIGSSLHLVGSRTVAWKYADGTTGSWKLY